MITISVLATLFIVGMVHVLAAYGWWTTFSGPNFGFGDKVFPLILSTIVTAAIILFWLYVCGVPVK